MTPFSLYVWVFKFAFNRGTYLSSGASNIHFLHEALKGVEKFYHRTTLAKEKHYLAYFLTKNSSEKLGVD
jgi:hypothetical protein